MHNVILFQLIVTDDFSTEKISASFILLYICILKRSLQPVVYTRLRGRKAFWKFLKKKMSLNVRDIPTFNHSILWQKTNLVSVSKNSLTINCQHNYLWHTGLPVSSDSMLCVLESDRGQQAPVLSCLWIRVQHSGFMCPLLCSSVMKQQP